MSDPAPFPAFRPATPKDAKPPITLATSAADPVEKPKRKSKRTARLPADQKRPVELVKVPKTKRKYKKRDPNKAHKPRSIKVELSTALDLLAGVKEKDKAVLLHLVEVMQSGNKTSRKRIVATLARIFA